MAIPKLIGIQKNKELHSCLLKLTSALGNTISVLMKKVTITVTDDVARRARSEAAKRGTSLSRFAADLLKERYETERSAKLALLREFFDGSGYPGISKLWRGREALYAEREDELLSRYESSRS